MISEVNQSLLTVLGDDTDWMHAIIIWIVSTWQTFDSAAATRSQCIHDGRRILRVNLSSQGNARAWAGSRPTQYAQWRAVHYVGAHCHGIVH